MPVVRFGDNFEEWGQIGVADPDGGERLGEEPGGLAAKIIEEVDSLAVFFPEVGRKPDDRPRIGTCGVGNQLPEMVVVGDLQLVLDDQHTVVREVAPEQVDGVPAHRMLGAVKLQVNPERNGKDVGVVQQPRRERVSFMRPDGTRIDTSDT